MSRPWTLRTTRTGIEYGGTASSYYWTSSVNPYAYPSICLANCTCYAWGRIKEAGDSGPFDLNLAIADLGGLPSAWQWHWYPNTTDGWNSYPFTNKPDDLKAGDLVIWSDNVNGNTRNHVAVIEQVITNRKWIISESLYTDAGTIRATNNFNTISSWMIANVPSRFFQSRTLDLDDPDPQWYGEQWPDYVLLNPNSRDNGSSDLLIINKTKQRRRIIRYV